MKSGGDVSKMSWRIAGSSVAMNEALSISWALAGSAGASTNEFARDLDSSAKISWRISAGSAASASGSNPLAAAAAVAAAASAPPAPEPEPELEPAAAAGFCAWCSEMSV